MSAFRPVLAFLLERLTLAAVGVWAALVVFLILAHEVHAGETLRFDTAVFHYFQDRQQPWVRTLMAGVSLLASGWAISGVSAIDLLIFWRKPAARVGAVSFLLAVAGGQGVVYGLKALFQRARPEPIFASLGYSFPSGHSFAAVTIYGFLAYWLTHSGFGPRRLWIWIGAVWLIGLIGFSRIYLGVHYASDVLAGFAAGWPWLWGCLTLPARRKQK